MTGDLSLRKVSCYQQKPLDGVEDDKMEILKEMNNEEPFQ